MTKQILAAVLLAGLCRPGIGANAPKPNSPTSLTAAVQHLISTFGDRYPQGRAFLGQTDRLKPADTQALTELQRRALLASPLLSGAKIVFVTRKQYSNNHGTEATMCQTGEVNTGHFRAGGALKILELPSGKVTTLLETPKGVIRDPEVHFDAGKILLSMRKDINDDYHLYELDISAPKGKNLKQLTFAPRVSDIQPIYLPNGRIAFASTREPKYIPCQRHLMANLFVMDSDGANIRQIGHNTQFEGRPSLTSDGRILYTRWEYVDKHFASAYGLWTVNPDGTNHALYYGGYAWQPGAISDGRVIPGTSRFVGIFTAVHELAWGAMVIADRNRGLDGTAPVLKSWPADISKFMNRWDTEKRIGNGYDSFRGVRVKYEDPYPLSAEFMLCSRQTGGGKHMGIFLVDVFGNEILLHAERPGCFDPIPIVARRRPPVIASKVDLGKSEGTFYVQDVYIGESMNRVKRGDVKYLRVVEAPPKLVFPKYGIGDWTPALSADSHHPTATNWNHYNNKRILGRVPVEADGSAYFTVPAGKFVYFQLLDKNGMMIHSMRSGTMLQPGEEAGCIGCHEDRLKPAPPSRTKRPTAMKRPPSRLEPWYGPARNFSYAKEVQPVLDKHCVRCHDYDKTAPKLNLSGDKGPAFNLSYTNLLARAPAVWKRTAPGEKKPLISSAGAGPIKVIPPYSWGSRVSGLVDLLRNDHGKEKVKLDAESLDRIITWIDLNAPYYPSHATYYGANTFGRCPLGHKELAQLGKLTKKYSWSQTNSYSVRQLNSLIMTHGSPINFTRPEKSLCLTGFTDKTDADYIEALEIIRNGARMLKQHPRLDMKDFKPSPADQARLDYYAKRREIEKRNRRAIVEGKKVYDR
jgi:hypothetical protein